MSKIFAQLYDLVGVPAAGNSSTATLNIPAASDPGAGIMDVLRVFVGRGAVAATLAQMRSGIRDIKLNFGSETVQNLKASEVFMIQEVNGYTPENGELALYHGQPWRATVMEESVTAPDLRRVSKATLTMDVVNDATAFAFSVAEEYREEAKTMPNGTPVTGMIGYSPQIEDVAGGEPVINLDPVNGPLNRIYLQYPSTANVSRVRVTQGSRVLYDVRSSATVIGLKSQLKQMKLAIPANYTDHQGTWSCWPIVFDNTQRLTDAIVNTAGMQIQLWIDTAAGLRLLRETQLNRG